MCRRRNVAEFSFGDADIGENFHASCHGGKLRTAALCSDARLLAPAADEGWRVLGDTTEGAILVAAAKADIDLAAEARTPRVGAFPFDPAAS